MTDAEIIKALECCTNSLDCPINCPLYEYAGDCFLALHKPILDLINRQKAEIESLRKAILDADYSSITALKAKQNWHIENSEYIRKLNEENDKLTDMYYSMQSTLAKMSMGVEQAKAETIKEFAERLKAECRQDRYAIQTSTKFGVVDKKYLRVVDESDIDNLVKEMVGD